MKLAQYCVEADNLKIGAGLYNALQSSAMALNEWIGQQLDLLTRCGAQHVLMSGSGSSCFALVGDRETEQRIRREADALGITRVYSARAIYSPSIEQQVESSSS